MVRVINAHGSSENGNVDANCEVLGHEGSSVFFPGNLAFQKVALGNTRVCLLWLSYHDGFVFQVVVNYHLSDSHVFETALDNALLEVGEESQDL